MLFRSEAVNLLAVEADPLVVRVVRRAALVRADTRAAPPLVVAAHRLMVGGSAAADQEGGGEGEGVVVEHAVEYGAVVPSTVMPCSPPLLSLR